MHLTLQNVIQNKENELLNLSNEVIIISFFATETDNLAAVAMINILPYIHYTERKQTVIFQLP